MVGVRVRTLACAVVRVHGAAALQAVAELLGLGET
jgi:hypothetical protein